MYILAIETSCDETSAAVVKGDLKTDKLNILSNIVSSQVSIHAQWGGVVPNLAAREHLKNITTVLDEALNAANVVLPQVDLIAVTQGPGLIPALLIGTNAAKALSYFYEKPLLGIHHIEGHIYANFMQDQTSTADNGRFPILCLVVSGGHTQLVLMRDHLSYETIGQTLDDAAGEAFDKVAKILELGYPGGPQVSRRAQAARERLAGMEEDGLKQELAGITLPRPMLGKPNFDFSFSGLKTAVLYFYRKIGQHLPLASQALTGDELKDQICRAFEDAIIDVLVRKTTKAAEAYHPGVVMMAGGVAANSYLRERLQTSISQLGLNINFMYPPLDLCGDNAAMIGAAAFYRFQQLKKNNQLDKLAGQWKTLEAQANLKLG